MDEWSPATKRLQDGGGAIRNRKKAIETNAAVSQAERLRKLKTVMATQNAMFAMGGQSAGVGSASAIQSASMSEASREQRLENLQTDVATSSYDFNIWSAKSASKHAMSTSMLNFAMDYGARWHSANMKGGANFLKTFFGGKFGGGMGGGG